MGKRQRGLCVYWQDIKNRKFNSRRETDKESRIGIALEDVDTALKRIRREVYEEFVTTRQNLLHIEDRIL
jgi:hypothetical protein